MCVCNVCLHVNVYAYENEGQKKKALELTSVHSQLKSNFIRWKKCQLSLTCHLDAEGFFFCRPFLNLETELPALGFEYWTWNIEKDNLLCSFTSGYYKLYCGWFSC